MKRSELEALWAEHEFNSMQSSLDVMRDYVWNNLITDAESMSEEDLKARLVDDFEMSEDELK